MINTATGSQINSFMVRSYLQDGHSIAKATKAESFEGAISMGIPGIYENVRKVDVASLYPSIMIEYDVYNKYKDPKRHMLKSLEIFRDERLKNKEAAERTGEKYYDDLQNAQKILINSMYGFMGAEGLNYNYPEGAALVTEKGREILIKGVKWATGREIIKVVKKIVNEGKENERKEYEWVLGPKVEPGQGYTLVNVDTDSFSYVSDGQPTKEQFKKEIEQLNAIFPSLITWTDDGVYSKVAVLKTKNYILKKHKDWCKPKDLDKDGEPKITLKGSSLKDQKKEPALKEMLDILIYEILNGNNKDKINILIHKYQNEAMNVQNINRWCVKKTYTEKMREGEGKIALDVQNAVREALNAKVINRIQEGDKIYLYNAVNGERQKKAKGELQFYKDGRPKMEKNTILKFPELFANDFNVEHYLERIKDTAMILAGVINNE
jgi:DNA polymerase elongation subunit (family B)